MMEWLQELAIRCGRCFFVRVRHLVGQFLFFMLSGGQVHADIGLHFFKFCFPFCSRYGVDWDFLF